MIPGLAGMAGLIGNPGYKATASLVGSLTYNSSATNPVGMGNVSVPRAGLLVLFITGYRGNSGANQRSYVSSTVAGVSTTTVDGGVLYRHPIAIAALEVTAGTKAISVSFNNDVVVAIVQAILVENYEFATYSDKDSNINELTTTLTYDIPLNGVGLSGVAASTGLNTSWSNATELADTTVGGGVTLSVAKKEVSAADASYTATASWASDPAAVAGAAASWS